MNSKTALVPEGPNVFVIAVNTQTSETEQHNTEYLVI